MNRSFSFKDRLPWMIAYQGYRILAAYSYTSLPRFACCRQLIELSGLSVIQSSPTMSHDKVVRSRMMMARGCAKI